MKRNLLLLAAVIVSFLLGSSSIRRIQTFRTTSQQVAEAEVRLEKLREENAKLKAELEYKKSKGFAEAEIRNKLGLAREGEGVVLLPNQAGDQQLATSNQQPEPNWQKRVNLFFGS